MQDVGRLGQLSEEARVGAGSREELLAEVGKLARIVMDRLEEGSREKLIDQDQTRLLGGIALRALRLWHDVLNKQPKTGTKRWVERKTVDKEDITSDLSMASLKGAGLGDE